METTAGQVLKANDVNMQGQFRLELGATSPASPMPSTAPVSPAAPAVSTAGPQVRIVETCNEYAVLEVTCGCGQKHLVRCDVQPPAA